MELNKTILPLLLFSSLSFSGCRYLIEPEYKAVKNFRISKLDGNVSTVKMDVVCYNPNKIGFRVKGTDLDIFIDENYAGHTTLDSTILAPANSDFVLPISVLAKNSLVYKNLFSAFLNQELTIKVSGTVKAGISGVYKNFKINYQEKQRISF
ncbi:MAG TPA: LEA type 2 family protein [Chitinophagaceae bacterium]|nr:LEA type 2 family protein [Chitinophagaceae bacterium]